MKNKCNMIGWRAFALAALAVVTGCQSTGKVSQASEQKVAVSDESRSTVAEKAPAPTEVELETVYFEFNRWQLNDETRSALRTNAQQLQAGSAASPVTVIGHCDERGSEEYNLALGERRAEAVKRYLVDLGIPASRIRTLSFGEARPAVQGTGEAVWSRNRRAELSLDTQQASL